MATTKQEALARLSKEDLLSAATLRSRVEEALKRYDGGTVYVTPVGDTKARRIVADEYRAAGWTVDFGSDQRDGDWMALK